MCSCGIYNRWWNTWYILTNNVLPWHLTGPHTWRYVICVLCCYEIFCFHIYDTWWRHQMETFSALLANYVENSPVISEFSAQRQVTRSFDVFLDLRLKKRLSKQSWCWRFETLARPLLRHFNLWINYLIHQHMNELLYFKKLHYTSGYYMFHQLRADDGLWIMHALFASKTKRSPVINHLPLQCF